MKSNYQPSTIFSSWDTELWFEANPTHLPRIGEYVHSKEGDWYIVRYVSYEHFWLSGEDYIRPHVYLKKFDGVLPFYYSSAQTIKEEVEK